jgi:hypothetical protein
MWRRFKKWLFWALFSEILGEFPEVTLMHDECFILMGGVH